MDDRQTTDDTTPIPWAVTETMPYAGPAPAEAPSPPAATTPAVTPPATTTPAVTPSVATAPAVSPPTWTGRKTAIAAALAIGISSLGAVGAAAALPAGTTHGEGGGQVQRGGFGGPGGQGGFGGPMQGQPPGQPGQQGQQGQGLVPNGQGGQAPGGQAPTDPDVSTT